MYKCTDITTLKVFCKYNSDIYMTDTYKQSGCECHKSSADRQVCCVHDSVLESSVSPCGSLEGENDLGASAASVKNPLQCRRRRFNPWV